MTIEIADFVLDKDYLDGDILTEDQLDAALIDADSGSVQQYIKTYVTSNMVQMAKDIFPDEWIFNEDAAKSVTNTMFDKQSSTATYAAGNIDIETSTDTDFEAVNATNAKITFSPEYKGKYKITFHFCHKVIGSDAAAGDVVAKVKFKIGDGTTSSPIAVVHYGEQTTAAIDVRTQITPMTLSVVIDVTDTSADVDVYLYKYNVTLTKVTTNEIAASAADGQLYAQVEKI